MDTNTTYNLTQEEVSSLSKALNRPENDIRRGATLIMDGTIEEHLKQISLCKTKEEQFTAISKLFHVKYADVAVDILRYYGKEDN